MGVMMVQSLRRCEGRSQCNDDYCIFKDVDGDETTVFVVLDMQQGALQDFLGPGDEPPERERDGIPSS